MEEKKTWAKPSKDMPITKRAIRLEPKAKATASGAPLKNIRVIRARPR